MKPSLLFKQTDIAPLAVYRILMGLLMAAEGFGAILTGWVKANYVEVPFAFHFIGFDFLDILVGPQAYVVYFLLGVSGLGIAFGYRYRLSVAVYTVLWAAVYFGQKTSYNNHYYLLLLICLLLFIVPANRYASLDVRSKRVASVDFVPHYSVWVFKALLLIVYFYAALAKLYPDWLAGKAVTIFLSNKGGIPFFQELFKEQSFVMLISYGGILFDFLIIPALWFKPTRKIAFAVSIFFHLFNSIVFHIGIFPYMMLITSVLFFETSTIRKLFFKNVIPDIQYVWQQQKPKRLTVFLAMFFGLMILLPLRPFYFPGSSHWTEEGHRLSWHMMLRSKSGHVTYQVKSSKQERAERIIPSQNMPKKMARKIATRPDMIWQYAQRLKVEYTAQGYTDIEVYADAYAKLNGRPMQRLVNQHTDLANISWNYFGHNEWILPHPDLN